ncbi:hypothetical protein LMG28614_04270 [Paraburkholderia ultramafica]|uniref:Uncharacterized protein n=1 Tax=Paraburkholderia ultramafica TaxID=1544867 RepID=A0A6S7BDP5_9BURK|nr:hypothetical protein LMG28614_04270 [Paraburkholderia ultramafica]
MSFNPATKVQLRLSLEYPKLVPGLKNLWWVPAKQST